jgi:hypothetical protein
MSDTVVYGRPTITYKEKLPPPSKRNEADWLVFAHRRLSAPEKWDPKVWHARDAAGEFCNGMDKQAVAFSIEGALGLGEDVYLDDHDPQEQARFILIGAALKLEFLEKKGYYSFFDVRDWEWAATTTFEQVHALILEACVIACARRYGSAEVVISRLPECAGDAN